MGVYKATQETAPSAPAAGRNVIYPKSDGLWYSKDSSGGEYSFATGGVGVPTSNRTIIINGNFTVAQRGTSFAAVASGAYTLDRWGYLKVGAMVHTASQDTNVPSVAQANILFTNSHLLTLTTADTSIAAGDICTMQQRIEGYNFRALAQKTFVMSFWIYATTTGVYCVSFRNSGSDRSYVAEYMINATNTWEKKTVVVSASPSAGTWDYTSGIGVVVDFTLASGSTFQTTPGSWQTGNFTATTNQVNGVNTGSTEFRLAGVQIEPGLVATPFETRLFSDELALCQRYYEKSFPQGTAPAQNLGVAASGAWRYIAGKTGTATQTLGHTPFQVTKRATPTVITFNPSAANAQVRDSVAAADCSATSAPASDRGLYVSAAGNAATVVGNALDIAWTADAEL